MSSRNPAALALAMLATAACTLSPSVGQNQGESQAPAADAGPDAAAPVTMQLLALAGFNGQLESQTSRSSAGDTTVTGGLPLIASYFKSDRERNPNTVAVMSGDSLGVSSVLSSYFGELPTVEAMGLLGIVADTPGKHPFNLGTEKMKALYQQAPFTTVATNLGNVPENFGASVKSPYHLVEVGPDKVKVAFLGIHNQDLVQSIFPGKMGSVTIREPVSAATTAAREARAAGASVVVGLTTMDANRETAGVVGQLADFARQVEGIDVLVGRAYRATELAETINGTFVVTPLQYGRSYGKVQLTLTGRKVTAASGEIVPVLGSGAAADPDADALLSKYQTELRKEFDKVVTVGGRILSNSNAMRQAIPLGNYIADAMLDRYKSAGATLAVMNGGGIRASLPSTYKVADTSLRRAGTPYDLVVGDVYSVLPFNNRCVVRSITGDVLWQMLEHAVYTMPDARGRFLQVAGIEFTWKESAAPSARVQSIKLPDGSTMTRAIRDGDPAAWATFAAKEFTIVLNDYNNSGGDGYAMLVEATPSPAGDLLTDVLLEYIKTHPVADADGTERIVRQQ